MNSQWENMKLKIAEIVICLVAVLLGLLYLNTDWIHLGVLLPLYAVFFTAIPVLRIVDVRQSGRKGLIAILPAIFYLLIALVVIVAAVTYFVAY